MAKRPQIFRPHGRSQADQAREYEQARGSSAVRLYDGQWEREASAFLDDNPLCRYCELQDFVTAATLVDHFWPHRGNRLLFWRREFWVPSCASCHSGMKQRMERAGLAAIRTLADRLGIPLPG